MKIHKYNKKLNMKNYQFEEITFWLSLIACLLAYDAGVLWLAKILVGISVINLFCTIVMVWIDVKYKNKRNG
jgi:hypothetical protein